jgi:hypothetical protein
VLFDRVAQRYGVLPTALLNLPLDEWTLVMAVADAGAREDKRQADDHKRQMERARQRRGR